MHCATKVVKPLLFVTKQICFKMFKATPKLHVCSQFPIMSSAARTSYFFGIYICIHETAP